MNSPMIRVILGHIMKIEAAFMLLPCIVAVIYGENVGWTYLAIACITALLGVFMTLKKPADSVMYLKEGSVATVLGWVILSLFGCLPFYFSGEIPSFTDALFETISGFTTTGASILSDVEALSHTALFWRSFTHWLGGMGVLVFLLAIVPLSGGSTINLMKAESPGPSVGKLVPKIKATARTLYLIYTALTLMQIIFMVIGGCSLFDAVNLSFATAGTGGFGVRGDSLASYSPYIQWVVIVFMILFGVNFNAFYLITLGKIKDALHVEEVKYYLLIILSSTAIIFINIFRTCKGIEEALRTSFFQVAAIITTTGFATADFDTWNTTCKIVIVMLMFVGACAGSTGGGIKVSRFIVMFRTIKKEMNTYIHPKSVKKIMLEGKPVEHEVVRSINVYMGTYIMIFAISIFLVSFNELDLITSFTAVATTINNVGPGLNLIGPTCNFGFLTPFTKYVLMIDMLAGRLELFPLLILIQPKVIKGFFERRPKAKKAE